MPQLYSQWLRRTTCACTTTVMLFLSCLTSAAGVPESTIEAKVCSAWQAVKGISGVKVVQFLPRETRGDQSEEAHGVLRRIEKVSGPLKLNYLGFVPESQWFRCTGKKPSLLFARNVEGEWEFVSSTMGTFLQRQLALLPDERRGSPEEAYLLMDLANTGARTRRLSRLNKAFLILETGEDPNRRMGELTGTLLGVLRDKIDPAMTERYLTAYAKVAETQRRSKGELSVIQKSPPSYPERARMKGKQGCVVVEFTVDAAGVVRDPKVIEESQKGWFGKAAKQSTMRFRYLPRVVNGIRLATPGERTTVCFGQDSG